MKKTFPVPLTPALIRSLLPPRAVNGHKGDYGHVLVVAGSPGMTGAAALCANAALRSGAGLVTLAVAEGGTPVSSALRPEVMTLPLARGRWHSFAPSSVHRIKDYISARNVTALAVGPGIGHTPDTTALIKALLAEVSLPVVLDADGLNVLAGATGLQSARIEPLWQSKADIIVTPHPGELARLCGCTVAQIQADRAANAARFACDNRLICVLKGHHTVIADADAVYMNATGNPGMATGGSGDVLAGMIAALVAQVRTPALLYAALAGVYLHGLAGDIAVRAHTEIALVAGDIIDALPSAIKETGIKNSIHHGERTWKA